VRDRFRDSLAAREVHDAFDSLALQRRPQDMQVVDVNLGNLGRAPGDFCDTPWNVAPRIREIVDDEHVEAALEKLHADVRADEAAAAGHEDRHRTAARLVSVVQVSDEAWGGSKAIFMAT